MEFSDLLIQIYVLLNFPRSDKDILYSSSMVFWALLVWSSPSHVDHRLQSLKQHKHLYSILEIRNIVKSNDPQNPHF